MRYVPFLVDRAPDLPPCTGPSVGIHYAALKVRDNHASSLGWYIALQPDAA